ncbi:MAG: hypothetical protein ABI670_22675 [Chloroflexota bacterium]
MARMQDRQLVARTIFALVTAATVVVGAVFVVLTIAARQAFTDPANIQQSISQSYDGVATVDAPVAVSTVQYGPDAFYAVSTREVVLGIMENAGPTGTPAPPTATPTTDPIVMSCVATVEAIPAYPTTALYDTFRPDPQKSQLLIGQVRSYLLGLSGKIIAHQESVGAPLTTTATADWVGVRGYEVEEVNLPCPMDFGLREVAAALGAPPLQPQGNYVDMFWKIKSITGKPLPVASWALETCIDDVLIPGGILFNRSLLREGATISFGYQRCGKSMPGTSLTLHLEK